MGQHHFNTALANEYDVDIAIMINNIDFWLHRNLTSGDGIYCNKVWTTFKPTDMTNYFTYWNATKIRRVLISMVKDYNILIKDQFHKVNRVNSYTFTDEFIKKFGSLLNVISFFDVPKEENVPDAHVYHFNHVNSEISDTRSYGKGSTKTGTDNTLSKEDFDLLPYLELWNSYKGILTEHNLPKSSEDTCTKTVLRSIRKLQGVLAGGYFVEGKVPSKWIHPEPISGEEIKTAIHNFALAKQENYTPENKKYLANSFSDFIFDERRNISDFLYYKDNKPIKQYVYTPSKELKDKYLSLFNGDISKKHISMLDNKLKALYNVFQTNKYLCEFYHKYETYLGTETAFFNTHINYLKDCYSEYTIGHLNTYGKVWERYKGWLYDQFKIKIELDAQSLLNLKKQRKIYLIQSGKASSDNFDDDYNYIT